MAKNVNNTIIHGVSGKFGDQIVFRQVNGNTLLCKAPTKGGTTSPMQQTQRDRFRKASQYAKSALEDAYLSTAYTLEAKKKKGISAYNVALADYLTAPDIELVDTSAYTGNVGDVVRVRAFDDFRVASVQVQVLSPTGAIVEQGGALAEGLDWLYTAQMPNATTAGGKIVVTATDLPGNETEKSVDL